MRIIIEVDNATPMTLQTNPSTEGQSDTVTPQAASTAAAIDAGTAPADHTDETGVEEFADDPDNSSAEETSAGVAPDH